MLKLIHHRAHYILYSLLVIIGLCLLIFFIFGRTATGTDIKDARPFSFILAMHHPQKQSPAPIPVHHPSIAHHIPVKPVQHPKPSQPPELIPDTHMPPVQDGLPPVITTIPTDEPVVFLTIDDGAHKSPDELQALQDNHVKATLFLAQMFVLDNPHFFDDFMKAGYPIEDHSINHLIDLPDIKNYAVQKQQICDMADWEQQTYGRRPIYFRPPGGSYSAAMRQAAADCGMKAIVTWIAKANGGSMQYQIGDHLRPGDIVLMHFRPEFQQDLKAFMDAANAQHLRTELLQDWLR